MKMTFAEILALSFSVGAFTFAFAAWCTMRVWLTKLVKIEQEQQRHLVEEHGIYDADAWQESFSDSSNWTNLPETKPLWLKEW
jgi:hypothetical protein